VEPRAEKVSQVTGLLYPLHPKGSDLKGALPRHHLHFPRREELAAIQVFILDSEQPLVCLIRRLEV